VLARLGPGRVKARPIRVLRRGSEADLHHAFDRASYQSRKRYHSPTNGRNHGRPS
jgi:hypothetical protein